MSILDSNPLDPSNAEIAARQIVQQARQTFAQMSKAFNDGSKLFWQNPRGATPTEIALVLGNNAKEVFELHYALGQLVGSIKPDSIMEGLSVVGQFTMNEDGTVTIVEPTTTQPPDPT